MGGVRDSDAARPADIGWNMSGEAGEEGAPKQSGLMQNEEGTGF